MRTFKLRGRLGDRVRPIAPRSWRLRALAGLALLVAVRGAALAHVGHSEDPYDRVLEGIRFTFITPVGFLEAGREVPITVVVVDDRDWALDVTDSLHGRVEKVEGEGTPAEIAFVEAQPGVFEGAARFDAPGGWRAVVGVDAGPAVVFPLPVYPSSPYRVDFATLLERGGAPFPAGRDTPVLLVVREAATGAPAAAPDDARLHVERHAGHPPRFAASWTTPLVRAETPGGLAGRLALPVPGSYRVTFASPSLGFAYGTRPPFEVLAEAPEPTGAAPVPAAGVAAAAAVAFVAATTFGPRLREVDR